ncbi:MAG: anhydro-N-acetylmuramic acid kinase [Gammaproteobacteria bacterium]|nr:anhydro-N-acetylmuramic acid kinase [Gammaproteobacteria bacterium]MBP9728796.1 anhydro-N-acetylmuramic acid kinase [Gammaproteobacteria bacterium]
MLSIGLMSGTSMDGIDAALLETDGAAKIKLLGHGHLAYELPFIRLLKTAEWAIRQAKGDLVQAASIYTQIIPDYLKNALMMSDSEILACIQSMKDYLSAEGSMDFCLEAVIQHSTNLHARAVQQLLAQTGYRANDIDVVGYHGQAMYHQPLHSVSIIVGDGQVLANHLKIKVVNDFRSADIALGGQGAPFAPLYHQALVLHDQPSPAVVVNCGGIANITVISSADPNDLIAFDTGPGNVLMDQLVRQRTKGAENMDRDGHYGAKGKVHPAVLKLLYEKAVLQAGRSYLLKPAPKSLDSGDLQLIPELATLSLMDACATLAQFTAETIVQGVEALDVSMPSHWILAGGGWNNPVIYNALAACLARKLGRAAIILHADVINWHSQSLEAQMFAYYAVCCLQQKPISFPGTTGVAKPTCGGVCHAPQQTVHTLF